MGRVGKVADQFVIRLPDGMRDKIAASAEDAGRSMNTELVQRLEWSFLAPPERVEELQAEIMDRNREIVALQAQLKAAVSRSEVLAHQRDDLQLTAALSEERAKAFYDVFTYTSAVLAAATGHDKKAMDILATAIRSMADKREDSVRSELIERLAEQLKSKPEPS